MRGEGREETRVPSEATELRKTKEGGTHPPPRRRSGGASRSSWSSAASSGCTPGLSRAETVRRSAVSVASRTARVLRACAGSCARARARATGQARPRLVGNTFSSERRVQRSRAPRPRRGGRARARGAPRESLRGCRRRPPAATSRSPSRRDVGGRLPRWGERGSKVGRAARSRAPGISRARGSVRSRRDPGNQRGGVGDDAPSRPRPRAPRPGGTPESGGSECAVAFRGGQEGRRGAAGRQGRTRASGGTGLWPASALTSRSPARTTPVAAGRPPRAAGPPRPALEVRRSLIAWCVRPGSRTARARALRARKRRAHEEPREWGASPRKRLSRTSAPCGRKGDDAVRGLTGRGDGGVHGTVLEARGGGREGFGRPGGRERGSRGGGECVAARAVPGCTGRAT